MTDAKLDQRPRRRRGGLWHHLDFRRLWIGETVSQFGTMISQLALPLVAILVVHASTFEVGLLTAFESTAFLVVGLPAGAWVDRMRLRWVLIVNDLIRAAMLGSIPLAQLIGLLTIGQLYVVALVTGVSTVFFDVAYQSYLPRLVDRVLLVEGNAKLQASESVSEIAGPSVGGLLIQALTAPYAVLIDALSFLWSAAGLPPSRPGRPGPSASRTGSCAARSATGCGSCSATGCCARSRRAPARPTCSARSASPCSTCCSRATCTFPPASSA